VHHAKSVVPTIVTTLLSQCEQKQPQTERIMPSMRVARSTTRPGRHCANGIAQMALTLESNNRAGQATPLPSGKASDNSTAEQLKQQATDNCATARSFSKMCDVTRMQVHLHRQQGPQQGQRLSSGIVAPQ
jgi:hypothetical protein